MNKINYNKFLLKQQLLQEIKQTSGFMNHSSVKNLLSTFKVGCEFELYVNNIDKVLKNHIKEYSIDWARDKTYMNLVELDEEVNDLFRGVGLLFNKVFNEQTQNRVLYTPQYISFESKDDIELFHVNTKRKMIDSKFQYWHITSDLSLHSINLIKKFPIELKTPVFPLTEFFGHPNTSSSEDVFSKLLQSFILPYTSSSSYTGIHVNISSSLINFGSDIHWPLVLHMMSFLNRDNDENDISSDFENRAENTGIKNSTGYSVHNLNDLKIKEEILKILKNPNISKSSMEVSTTEINHWIKTRNEKHSMINFTKMDHNVLELRVMGGKDYEHKSGLIKEYVYKFVQAIILSSEVAIKEVWGIHADRKIDKVKKSSLKSTYQHYQPSIEKELMIERTHISNLIIEFVAILESTPVELILPTLLETTNYKTLQNNIHIVYDPNNSNYENKDIAYLRNHFKLPDKLKLKFLRWLNKNYVTNNSGNVHTYSTPLYKAIMNPSYLKKHKISETTRTQFIDLLENITKLISH